MQACTKMYTNRPRHESLDRSFSAEEHEGLRYDILITSITDLLSRPHTVAVLCRSALWRELPYINDTFFHLTPIPLQTI
jgi:hypothetical protein